MFIFTNSYVSSDHLCSSFLGHGVINTAWVYIQYIKTVASKDTVQAGDCISTEDRQSLYHQEKLGKLSDNQYYHCQLILTWGKDIL